MSKPGVVTANTDGTVTTTSEFTVKGVKKRSTTVTRTTTKVMSCTVFDKNTGSATVDHIEVPVTEIISCSIVNV